MGTNVQAFGAGYGRATPAVAPAPGAARPGGATFTPDQQQAIQKFAQQFGIKNVSGFTSELTHIKQASAAQLPTAVAGMAGFLRGQGVSTNPQAPHGGGGHHHSVQPHQGHHGHRHHHCADGPRGAGGPQGAGGPHGAGGSHGSGNPSGAQGPAANSAGGAIEPGWALQSGPVGGGAGLSPLETALNALFAKLGITSPQAKAALHDALQNYQSPIPAAQGAAADPASAPAIRAA